MRLKLLLPLSFVLVVLVSSASARPGMVACAITANDTPLDARQQLLLSQSRDRIRGLFGPLKADPTIVLFDDPDAYWPLRLNSYGSTSFLGARTCVMIGPDGQNVDVTAHELMHAELAERLGYWTRLRQIPTWFDEGLAMQVDFRSNYELADDQSREPPNFVTDLDSAADFFVADGERLTAHYAAAKAWVGRWLEQRDTLALFAELEGLSAGSSFVELVESSGQAEIR